MKGTVLTLNNGIEMPALGLGVFQSPGQEAIAAVASALAQGYRMIDTAAIYKNEAEVGQGIRESGVPRAELFVQTKLWVSDFGYDSALHAFDRSLRKLGLDYLDLYLLHWPVPGAFDRTIASWKAAERLLAEGRVRAIGICNATPAHLRRLAEHTEVVPAVNQVELHPYFTQPDVRQTDREAGIVTQAWSPIGGVKRYWGDPAKLEDPLQDPLLKTLAERHGKTPAQIVLRWHLELGHSIIPKSVNPKRIGENGDVFDFALTPEEVSAITALDRASRGGPDPDDATRDWFKVKVDG